MGKENYLTDKAIRNSPFLAIDQLGMQLGASLIIAPHPDDEALGCGGLIAYLREENVPVWVCFITSGGASHPNSKSYPLDALKDLREKEALKSCDILGVASSNVLFFNQPDGGLADMNDDQNNKVVEKLTEIIEETEICTVFVPWRRDPHPDHKASYSFGEKAVKNNTRNLQLVEYPIWIWKNSQEEDWPIIGEVETFQLHLDTVLKKKKEAIFAHQSQVSDLINDDPEGFKLTEDLLNPFLSFPEVYFFNSEIKSTSLEEDYFDQIYAENPDPWNFIASDYENDKYHKINSFLGNKHFERGLELGCSIGVQTEFLAKHCDHLLAVDISADAIETAKTINANLSNVKFEVSNVLNDFPEGQFDFISMCEMGYYLSEEHLMSLFKKISEQLNLDGYFLMVHWTSFVREYAMTGRQVHHLFEVFNQDLDHQFKRVSVYGHESYELVLWEKVRA